jgi:hypothetical protein
MIRRSQKLMTAQLRVCLLVLSLFSGTAFAAGMTEVGKPYESTNIPPGERMFAGSERDVKLMSTGAIDTVTAPATLARQITDETKNYGVAGIVSGTVRGGLKSGVQVMRGGTRILIGILDVLAMPIGGFD